VTSLRSFLSRLAAARPAEAARFAAWVADRTRDTLSPRATLLAPVRAELDAALPEVDALEDTLARARAHLDPGPFRADMSVHAAHARHPGATAIFAARGLPACTACAVGVDETLAEACEAEGLALPELLDALRALESGCASS